jgi:hypothetical protein
MAADSETHRSNYRIAFDAMRAYHSSEIEHKKDMITILNGVLTSIITVFAGIFYFILSKDFDYLLLPEDQLYLRIIFYILFIVVPLLYIYLIEELKRINVQKINGDNDTYEKFRRECQFERDALELTEYFKNKNPEEGVIYWELDSAPLIKPPEDRSGSGYNKTIGIINTYSKLIEFIVIYLAIIAITLLFSKASPFH